MAIYQNYQTEHYTDLREMYRASAKKYGDATLFMQKENGVYQNYSYNRFASDVGALGTALCDKGLKNAHVMLIGEGCYHWILSYMAVICGVGIIIPTDHSLAPAALAELSKTADATAVIYSEKAKEKLECLDESIAKISFAELDALILKGKSLISDGIKDYLDAPIDPNAMSALLFTSGTSGQSKAVMLSHANICTNLSEMCKMVRIDENDTFLSVLPMHHAFECTCGVLVPLSRGATVAFAESLRRMMQNIQEVHPTVINCVPMFMETIYEKIWANIRRQGLERRVRTLIKVTSALRPDSFRMASRRRVFATIHKSLGGNLRMIITRGAAAKPEVLHGMRRFGIIAIQSYGLTECAPLAAINRDTHFNDRSAGMATPNALLDIYDIQKDGTGEIRYKGANVMLGYYKMPEKTQKVLRDGWLYTGDLGYMDENGFLYITGRKKNVIVTATGKHVFPEELELLLTESPYVKDAVVLGMLNEKKNDYDVVAVIHPNIPHTMEVYGKDYTAEQLDLELKKAISEVNAQVDAHKRITTHILRTEPFPKNTSGKIVRAPIIAEYVK